MSARIILKHIKKITFPIALLVAGDISLQESADLDWGYIVAGGTVSTDGGGISMSQGRLGAAALASGRDLLIGNDRSDEICVLAIGGDVAAKGRIDIFGDDVDAGGDIAIIGNEEDTAIAVLGERCKPHP